MAKCALCGKVPVAGNNVPHSVHKTRRMFRPNIQKVNGVNVCSRCIRTMKRAAAPVAKAEQTPATA